MSKLLVHLETFRKIATVRPPPVEPRSRPVPRLRWLMSARIFGSINRRFLSLSWPELQSVELVPAGSWQTPARMHITSITALLTRAVLWEKAILRSKVSHCFQQIAADSAPTLHRPVHSLVLQIMKFILPPMPRYDGLVTRCTPQERQFSIRTEILKRVTIWVRVTPAQIPTSPFGHGKLDSPPQTTVLLGSTRDRSCRDRVAVVRPFSPVQPTATVETRS